MARPFRLPRSVQELADLYMRYISPLSLIAGFLLDTFVLAKRVDLLYTNLLLGSYLLISAVSIILINLIQTGRLQHAYATRAYPLLPLIVQFCFGGLFSAYLSLYSRSASVAVSWIFIALIAGFVLLNERFAHFYARFFVQVSLYFTVLFSFLIFFLPVVFHRIGPVMFFASGLSALALMALFLGILFHITPPVAGRIWRSGATMGGIFLLFNVLYFTNAIPPLPLALKSGGVFHSVQRSADGSYQLLGEEIPWYEKFLNYAPVYHHAPGQPIYVWSAVFAPSGLSTQVLHRWQRYDSATHAWVAQSTVRFAINGGRDGGYRGWSEKVNVQPGQWRVDVLTPYGQLIGRIGFTVVEASSTGPLVLFTQ